MRRVMIVGQPGAGKSWLAREMGRITGLSVFHVDRIHWMPGWVERPASEKSRLCREVHARERWIFEGGHSATWVDRLARADTLIWLDLPLALRLLRVGRRWTLHRGRSRPDLPEVCPERLDPAFLRWIWETRHTGRAKMRALFESAPPEKDRHRLASRGEVEIYLAGLRRGVATSDP